MPAADRRSGRTPLRPCRLDRPTGHCGKTLLQIAVVLALVGEQEIGPAQVIDDVGGTAPAHAGRQVGLETRDAFAVRRPRGNGFRRVGVHHGKRERLAEREAQRLRPERLPGAVRLAGRVDVAAFREHAAQLQQHVRVVRRGARGARVARDRRVEVAPLPLEVRERLHRRRIGLQRQRPRVGVARTALVADIEQHRGEIAPPERIVGLRLDRPARRRHGFLKAPHRAQRAAEIAPRARVLRVYRHGASECFERPFGISAVDQQDPENVLRACVARLDRQCGAQILYRLPRLAHRFARLRAQKKSPPAIGAGDAGAREDGGHQRCGRRGIARADLRLGLGEARIGLPCVSHLPALRHSPALPARAAREHRDRRVRARACAPPRRSAENGRCRRECARAPCA